jgi:hypothetical protein
MVQPMLGRAGRSALQRCRLAHWLARVCPQITDLDLSDDEVQQRAEADRREVDPPVQVETAMWSKAGELDWWVKERQEWLGRVRGADGRQRSVRAVDLRPASGSEQ